MDLLSLQFVSTAFMLFTAGMLFLFAAGQLCGRRRYVENYVLASYLACIGLIIFQICMIVNGVYKAYPGVLFFHMTALYLMAPLLFCADYQVVLPVETMPRKTALLFLPALIGLAADIGYIIMPAAGRLALMADLFGGTPSPWGPAARVLIAGAGVLMLACLGVLLGKLAPAMRENPGALLCLLVLSLFVIAALSVATIAGYLAGSHGLLRWSGNLSGLLVIGAFVLSQRYPRILQLLMVEAEKRNPARSLLDQVDVSGLIITLDRLMTDERIYTDDQLTLRDLAGRLSVSPHQLSQLLNDRLNTNFNTYVNQHRIGFARDMLVNCPDRTVLAISLEAGFNSKSAFYEAFSRFTGMTPQAYRKRNGIAEDS
jgi:AraC-like DNA-binding protein